MPKKIEFHSVEFFRKIRDQQAALLSGKTPAEIVAFFAKTKPGRLTKRTSGARRQTAST
ncbi:MAG: hypothetical protein HY936_03000 [Nitrosomonadales bacterium]|nr:hypothetical protein [Nitrosomonadales bacterium]